MKSLSKYLAKDTSSVNESAKSDLIAQRNLNALSSKFNDERSILSELSRLGFDSESTTDGSVAFQFSNGRETYAIYRKYISYFNANKKDQLFTRNVPLFIYKDLHLSNTYEQLLAVLLHVMTNKKVRMPTDIGSLTLTKSEYAILQNLVGFRKLLKHFPNAVVIRQERTTAFADLHGDLSVLVALDEAGQSSIQTEAKVVLVYTIDRNARKDILWTRYGYGMLDPVYNPYTNKIE